MQLALMPNLLVAGMLWTGYAGSYGSLLLGRWLTGIGSAVQVGLPDPQQSAGHACTGACQQAHHQSCDTGYDPRRPFASDGSTHPQSHRRLRERAPVSSEGPTQVTLCITRLVMSSLARFCPCVTCIVLSTQPRQWLGPSDACLRGASARSKLHGLLVCIAWASWSSSCHSAHLDA